MKSTNKADVTLDANGTLDGKSLYEVLGLEKAATQVEIKKAYHKLALQLHPDKNPGDETAHGRFQTLQRVFAILGDSDRRQLYDETGSLEDSEQLSGAAFDSLYEYYRTMYPKVTEDQLDQFTGEYRGSPEETADLLRLYTQFRGNMEQVFDWQICSEPKKDSHRFMDAIAAAIDAGEAKSYKAFKAWAKETAAKSRPKDPLKPCKRKKGEASTEQDLALQIRSRNAGNFDKLMANLEGKYAGASKKKSKRRKN